MLSGKSRRYHLIVEQVRQVTAELAGEPLHIEFLCRTCGVTERMLRSAFRSIHGTTPYRHLRQQRMRAARAALLHADPAATVTAIATQFGFLELGRFSVEYRSVFGERPSDTLRRSAAPGSEAGVLATTAAASAAGGRAFASTTISQSPH